MSRDRALGWWCRLLTAAGLGVDAGVHVALAPTQPPGSAGRWSQIDLFYGEAAVSVLAAGLVLVTGVRLAYAVALLVAASALGAVVLSRYLDVGALGPLPDLYEPFWYASKLTAAVGEAIAVLAATAGVLLRSRRPPNAADPSAARHTRCRSRRERRLADRDCSLSVYNAAEEGTDHRRGDESVGEHR